MLNGRKVDSRWTNRNSNQKIRIWWFTFGHRNLEIKSVIQFIHRFIYCQLGNRKVLITCYLDFIELRVSSVWFSFFLINIEYKRSPLVVHLSITLEYHIFSSAKISCYYIIIWNESMFVFISWQTGSQNFHTKANQMK